MTNSSQKPPGKEPTDKDLEVRISKAKDALKVAEPEGLAEKTALGIAFRLVTELVAGVFVGGMIGWTLDRWLDTRPWLLVLFLIIGSVAGIFNVVRAARLMQDAQEKAQKAKNEKT